jgi:hypothetical protein
LTRLFDAAALIEPLGNRAEPHELFGFANSPASGSNDRDQATTPTLDCRMM